MREGNNNNAIPSHVLVVDDYDDAREMYAEFLELAGYRVSQAKNGAEALRKASDLLPDIILIVVTGHPPDDVKGQMLHYDAFVTKPCPPDELVGEVARLLASKKRAGPIRSR